jgi:hypothetical protein
MTRNSGINISIFEVSLPLSIKKGKIEINRTSLRSNIHTKTSFMNQQLGIEF